VTRIYEIPAIKESQNLKIQYINVRTLALNKIWALFAARNTLMTGEEESRIPEQAGHAVRDGT
jgi:hypothetical protein